jgi:hypothetical protein
MEIRRKNINGNNWELVNEYWETYNSWGHKTTIIRNGYDYGTHKVRYYNRTWESYTYQTCMSSAILGLQKEEIDKYIQRYKEKNNITRFRKGEKQQVIREFKDTELGKELDVLKNSVKEKNFD